MTLRAAHLALIGLALLPAYLGVNVIAKGLFDRSYDNTLWNYLGLGGLLLVIASALIIFAIRDARRRPPPC